MTIIHFLPIILAAIYGIAKAAAERVVDFYSWSNSVFAFKHHKDTTVDDLRKESPRFTHPREVSWARKDTGSRFMQKLKHTVLVGTTDLWHFADLICALVAFVLIPASFILAPPVTTILFPILMLGSWVAYAISFHLFYHKFFYFDKELRNFDLNEGNIQNN